MSKKWQAIILGIMCLLLTVAICVQIKTVKSNGTTLSVNQRESQLKDQVLKMKEKYDNSYEKLTRAEQELEETRKSVTSNNKELEALQEEITDTNILLGLTDVTGPGVTITVADAKSSTNVLNPIDLLVHDTDILMIVNELKNAGAEAIEINGKRVVETTSIMCDGNVITVNGEKISSPFVINAIGFPEQLATLTRAQGPLEVLASYNITATFNKVEKITIPKYTGAINFKTAKTKK